MKTAQQPSNEVVVDSVLAAMDGADRKHGEEQAGSTRILTTHISLPDGDPKFIRPMAEFEMRKMLRQYLLQAKEAGAWKMDDIRDQGYASLDSFLLGTPSGG